LEEIDATGTNAIDYNVTVPTSLYGFLNPLIMRSSNGNIYVKGSNTGSTQFFNLVRINPNYTGCSVTFLSSNATTTQSFTTLAGAALTATALVTSSLNPVYNTSATSIVSICNTSALSVSGSQNNPLCNAQCNGSATVSPSGGQSPYTYSWTPGGQTTSTRTNLCAGTYSCKVTDAYSVTAVQVVTITQPPAITLTPSSSSSSICSGNSTTLTANGSGGTGSLTYTWQPGNFTNTSVVVSPNATIMYSLTAKDINNCTLTANVGVTVNPSPTITVNSGSICMGQSFTLTPSGANTYTYIGGGPIVSPTTTSIYSITGSSSAGCAGTNTAISNITVNAIPTISVAGGAICPGGSFTFNPTGASTYTYSGGQVVSPTVTSTYSITGTSSAGCISTISAVASVSVTNNLTVTISGTNSICNGQSVLLTAGGAATYTWNTSVTTSTISPSPTSNTTYSVLGASGTCTSSALFNVTVNPTPTITASTNNTLICLGQVAVLTASGANSYTWNPGASNGSSISVSPTITTTYTVTGTNASGCSNTTTITQNEVNCMGVHIVPSITKEFIVYPNPFNNKITIESNSDHTVQIFNVLGSLICETKLEKGKLEIDLSKETNGMYFVKMGDVVKKIIKE
jgi:hypothetical protein